MQDNWEWLDMHGAEQSPQPEEQWPCNRDFAAMITLTGNRLLVFGGLDTAAKRLDDTWIFDCATSVPPPPPPFVYPPSFTCFQCQTQSDHTWPQEASQND
jgi:hypothetical protein